ncbi:hypothetical protein [Parasitella parasitica]|uniref:Uncharacterized protein n=1 Tax=Parasitella parasitica TaxID=35722 RepID=A0A0B7NGF9_9FUNG|nr:hypothetical protein [Parasitella parasitica]
MSPHMVHKGFRAMDYSKHCHIFATSLPFTSITRIEQQQASSLSHVSDAMPGLRRDLSSMDVFSDTSSMSGAPTDITEMPVDPPLENGEYRACTVSFKSLLRKDVRPDIAQSFLRAVNSAIHDVTDYIMDFQFIVFVSMLSIISSQIVVADTIAVEYNSCEGFQIQRILLSWFPSKSDTTVSAMPFSSSAFEFASFCNYLKELFQGKHINYIHTLLFGQRKSKIDHPLFRVLNASNEHSVSSITQKAPKPANELMQITLDLSKTNLKNMWPNNKLFIKTLNKLLEILLRIHLAPKRERQYKEFIESERQDDPGEYTLKQSQKFFSQFYSIRKEQVEKVSKEGSKCKRRQQVVGTGPKQSNSYQENA